MNETRIQERTEGEFYPVRTQESYFIRKLKANSGSITITSEDGEEYQITRRDVARQQQYNRIGWLFLSIGGVFVALLVLLMFLGAVASMFRAPTPPPPKINCPWIGSCSPSL